MGFRSFDCSLVLSRRDIPTAGSPAGCQGVKSRQPAGDGSVLVAPVPVDVRRARLVVQRARGLRDALVEPLSVHHEGASSAGHAGDLGTELSSPPEGQVTLPVRPGPLTHVPQLPCLGAGAAARGAGTGDAGPNGWTSPASARTSCRAAPAGRITWTDSTSPTGPACSWYSAKPCSAWRQLRQMSGLGGGRRGGTRGGVRWPPARRAAPGRREVGRGVRPAGSECGRQGLPRGRRGRGAAAHRAAFVRENPFGIWPSHLHVLIRSTSLVPSGLEASAEVTVEPLLYARPPFSGAGCAVLPRARR